jgi:hypothetical protein
MCDIGSACLGSPTHWAAIVSPPIAASTRPANRTTIMPATPMRLPLRPALARYLRAGCLRRVPILCSCPHRRSTAQASRRAGCDVDRGTGFPAREPQSCGKGQQPGKHGQDAHATFRPHRNRLQAGPCRQQIPSTVTASTVAALARMAIRMARDFSSSRKAPNSPTMAATGNSSSVKHPPRVRRGSPHPGWSNRTTTAQSTPAPKIFAALIPRLVCRSMAPSPGFVPPPCECYVERPVAARGPALVRPRRPPLTRSADFLWRTRRNVARRQKRRA